MPFLSSVSASHRLFFFAVLSVLAAPVVVFGYASWFSLSLGWQWQMHFWWLIFLLPILEELAFRGAIQGWFLQKIQWAKLEVVGFSLANWMTSVLFVIAHFWAQSWEWALLVFFPSLVFGWWRDATGKLWPSIVLHAFYNACFFVLITP